MRRFLIPLGLALAAMLSSCTVSKRVSFLEIPAEAGAGITPIDVNTYLDRYGDYPAVYLDFTEEIEHSGGKDEDLLSKWNMYQIQRVRYIVIDPDYAPMTTLLFEAKPKSAYMRTVDPDGTVRMWTISDLIEQKDSYGNSEYKFVYPNVKRGTLIDAGFEWGGSVGYWTPLSHDIPLQFEFPCEHIKVTYAYPDWWEVRVKRPAPDRSIPYTEDIDPNNHKVTMVYEASNVPALKSEPYAPFFRQMADYWEFRISHLEMKGRKYDSDESWVEQAEWWHKNYFKKAADDIPEIDSIVSEIVASNPTAEEQLTAILDWIRTNIKQEDPHRDGNVEKILGTGTGTPLDYCELTRVMAKSAGMDAQIVMGHDASDGQFDYGYRSGSQFTQPLVRVVANDVGYVLIPYWKNTPYYAIPLHLRGQPALVISKPDLGEIIDLPDAEPVRSVDDVSYDVAIGADGSVTVTETRTFEGTRAYQERLEMEDMDDAQKKDHVKSLTTFYSGDLDLISYEFTDYDDYHKPLGLSMSYTVGNLVTITPEEILVQTGGLLDPTSNREEAIDTTNRQNPVQIFNDSRFHKKITLHYPPNWQLVTPLPEVSHQCEMGSAGRTASVSPEAIEIDQTVELNHCRQPKEKVVDLAALVSRHSVLELPTLIFSVVPES